MSILKNDKLFGGLFSIAGIISADKYQILDEIKKVQNREKNKYFHDAFHPDKEWKESLAKKQKINRNEIIKGCKFNIDELKSDINRNNLYYINDTPKKIKNNKKNICKASTLKNFANKFNDNKKNDKKNKIINSINKRKYKYHDLHMKKIAKYKKEGLYDKILNQQESIYYPKIEYIRKRVSCGPQWQKLSGRKNLFEPDNKKANSINISSYNINDKKEDKNKKKDKSTKDSKVIIPDLFINRKNKYKRNRLKSAKYSNIMTKSTSIYSKINNNVYNNIPSTSDIINNNNKTIDTSNRDKSKKISMKTLRPNQGKILYNFKKCISVPDFDKYIDYEKIQKRIQKNQDIGRIRDVLNPNYSSIESDVKMFVKYNSRNKNEKKQKNEFEGINVNELLYDACSTFDKIYGNKMKAVPLFHKMVARPDDINLPSYMKGLYNRMGLYLAGEKTLKMNNYENSKIYKFDGDFTPKKNKYKILRKVRYEDEVDQDINKVEKDLELMKRKFNIIQSHIYE